MIGCCSLIRDCQLRFTPLSSSQFALPKALQPNASRSVGFFAFRLFTKVNFRHSLKTKKPPRKIRGGFVACIELHSNQMWKDLREFYKLVNNFENLIKAKMR